MVIEQSNSPRIKAGVISSIFFGWLVGLFWKGWNNNLQLEDLYRVLPEDKCKVVGDALQSAWNEELQKFKSSKASGGKIIKPSLIKALIKVWLKPYSYYAIFAFYEECIIKVAQPICLGLLLHHLKDDGSPEYVGYLTAFGVVSLSALYTTSDHPYTFAVQRMGMKMRVSLCSLVYQKVLRLSKSSLEETTSGQLVNFLSSDMNRFDIFFTFLHYIWVAPIQLAIVTAVLWVHLGFGGLPCLSGVTLLIIFVPLQALMGKMFSKLRAKTSGKTDRRLFIMEEIVSAIHVIKLYAWEKPFSAMIDTARKAEIHQLRMTSICKSINLSMFFVASRITLFLTLLTYILSGETLLPEMVFVALALYNNVQQVITLFFPFAIISLAETLVSIRRFEKFLMMDEFSAVNEDLSNQLKNDSMNNPSGDNILRGIGLGVKMNNVFAKWNHKAESMTLNNISLELTTGKIIAVIGPTGAGKGSILQAILHELPVQSGEIIIKGTIAYSSQEPWVFGGSVRENILFGKEYDSIWYDKVIEACALTRDLAELPFGDSTLVGEKGAALSGGQKGRVNLARAVYADADIYLMDDPLSAVDTEVSLQIVENCILGILRNKACIIVTHQMQFLKQMDEILLIEEGTIVQSGSYSDMCKSSDQFVELLNPNQTTARTTSVSLVSSKNPVNSNALTGTIESESIPPVSVVPFHKAGNIMSRPQSTVEEALQTGSIGMKLYWDYIRAGSHWLSLICLLLLLLFTQALYSGSDCWLQFWVKGELDMDSKYQVGIYSGFIVCMFILCLARTLCFYQICMSSSIELHQQLFNGIVRAPMLFFEKNPIGRILNRSAKDVNVMDETLPPVMFDTTDITLQFFGIIVIVSSTSPVMVIPAVMLIISFYFVRNFYFRTARSIKRLEGVARSPVFSHLSTTFDGLTTIRAFKNEKKFQIQFDDFMDIHSSVWYLFLATTRWLGIVVDWFSIFFVAVVTFNFAATDQSDSSMAGLAITTVISLTSMLQWGVRQSAEMSNQMVSIERIIEYCQLEPEAAVESDLEHKPPNNWPSSGAIQFNNVSLKYDSSSPVFVLKNISFYIHSQEKIGIIGRTGAGKSSLISVLFRIAEPCIEGFIEIDSINTSNIGLHDLRSKISIIPQEPVLFNGTLRYNLDPLSQYPDSDIWTVLQDVNLADELGSLNIEIAEGGANFSLGQRQLLCLGRAILRRNRILVLDEATANVDPVTDALIQKTIRTKFAECTVITIAHRLRTVMDSDRILVLDAGCIAEFDEPLALLLNTESYLNQLVQKSGKDEAHSLMSIARKAAETRRLKIIDATSSLTNSKGTSGIIEPDITKSSSNIEDSSRMSENIPGDKTM